MGFAWSDIVDLLYLLAAVLFIWALRDLSSPKTARRGNVIGAAGMASAIVATLIFGSFELEGTPLFASWTFIIIGLLVGSAIGVTLAYGVKMTSMPEMVGFLNGSGGLASSLVAIEAFWTLGPFRSHGDGVMAGISSLIGWVCFTGSLMAVAKLRDWVSTRPITFPLQKPINFGAIGIVLLGIVLVAIFPQHAWLLVIVIVLAALLGVLIVAPIGGADMPVVISVMNAFSGLAAAATGFQLGNVGLIISGALVGASGMILSQIMCVAMNRSLANVIFGAFGQLPTAGESRAEKRTVHNYSTEDAEIALEDAGNVVIIPGYGLAVAQAQHACAELAEILEGRGTKVSYAIHPVAGRMPGHMNVLLAEADVPYEQLLDLDAGNSELEQADVAIVLGANDVVNPVARDQKNSPIYGMPILNADKARTVIIVKRSLAPGFAGIDNPLFYEDKTMMLFGDAKKVLMDLVQVMKK